MKVFVAGATGALGRPLVAALVERGHDVTGMTRSPEKIAAIEEAGAHGVVCDAYEFDRLRSVVVAAAPDVVVHQLTDLPQRIDGKTDFGGNNRIRVEGTRNLVAAAQAAGARRLVAESIAFVYARTGTEPKHEDDELDAESPSLVDAVVSLEQQVLGADGLEGVVLRYGYLYGPGTGYARGGSNAELARRRRFPIVGDGAGVISFVHVDDAASATVAAVERGAPGVYNIVDDGPAPVREWLPVFAAAVGAPRPWRVPVWLARRIGGDYAVRVLTETRGASNEKAKRELGWQPRYASWREGFRDGLG